MNSVRVVVIPTYMLPVPYFSFFFFLSSFESFFIFFSFFIFQKSMTENVPNPSEINLEGGKALSLLAEFDMVLDKVKAADRRQKIEHEKNEYMATLEEKDTEIANLKRQNETLQLYHKELTDDLNKTDTIVESNAELLKKDAALSTKVYNKQTLFLGYV
jgi:hypothetical protein